MPSYKYNKLGRKSMFLKPNMARFIGSKMLSRKAGSRFALGIRRWAASIRRRGPAKKKFKFRLASF